jgi:hypothetical protein
LPPRLVELDEHRPTDQIAFFLYPEAFQPLIGRRDQCQEVGKKNDNPTQAAAAAVSRFAIVWTRHFVPACARP